MRARYWDSVTFIGWLAEESDKVEACRYVIQEAETGKLPIVTSALTSAEVLWVKGHERLAIEQARTIQQFFAHSYIAIRDLDRATAELPERWCGITASSPRTRSMLLQRWIVIVFCERVWNNSIRSMKS